jgi:malate dehydrogenase (oxaloacetate-decarboxylating)
LTDLRKIAIEIATAVGIEAVKEGVCPKATPDEIRQRVVATQWTPAYAPIAKS